VIRIQEKPAALWGRASPFLLDSWVIEHVVRVFRPEVLRELELCIESRVADVADRCLIVRRLHLAFTHVSLLLWVGLRSLVSSTLCSNLYSKEPRMPHSASRPLLLASLWLPRPEVMETKTFAYSDPRERRTQPDEEGITMELGLLAKGSYDTILWIIAAVLVIAGIVAIIRGAILWGIVLIIVGLLVGPGGVSLFS